jgi:hypothetical protein
MPIFGLGLHFIVAIFFAVHALRTHRNMYWLLILFSAPILGSIVYFIVEYLPDSRMNRGIGKAAAGAISLLDPEREVREARAAFDLSPSAQNRLRLAKALFARGQTHESIQHFDACLTGPFGKDPEILYAAASAKLQDGASADALKLALTLRNNTPDYLAERAMLLLAQAHEAAGDKEAAGKEYAEAAQRFASVEARARYAVFAAGSNNLAVAKQLQQELSHSERHWSSQVRATNRPYLQQVEKAIANAERN